jgi:hypothetical protein
MVATKDSGPSSFMPVAPRGHDTRSDRRGLAARLAALVLATAAAAPAPAQEFTEAELFFELNDTDGDLGIHASIDGGPYTRLEIEDPKGRTIFSLGAQGRLARQGLTQLTLESAEPRFEELAPERFFRRFPEGTYELEGTRDGVEFEASVELCHVLAAPVAGITISGLPAAEDCEADPLPTVGAGEPVVIDWEPVEGSHPEVGAPGEVEIDRYQLFVEQGDLRFAVDLPPTVTEFEVPAEIVAGGGRFKFEIIARTQALNNTAVESCFVVEVQ